MPEPAADHGCHVREGLVGWLHREHPAALPTVRVGVPGCAASAPHTQLPALPAPGPQAGLFTGSAEARERSRASAGPDDGEARAG